MAGRLTAGGLALCLSSVGLAGLSLGSATPAGAAGTTPPQFQVDCPSAPVEVGGDFDCNISILNGTEGDVVALSITSGGAGDFIDTPCQLNAELTCFMVFDATSGPPATGDLTGNDGFHLDFQGDDNLAAGTDDFLHAALQGTSTSVSCAPATQVPGSATTCTASIGGTDLTKMVTFTTFGTGAFSPSNTCAPAVPIGGGLACSVTYTPSGTGTPSRMDEIFADYDGYPDDPVNTTSNGSTEVAVPATISLTTTTTTVACAPNPVVTGNATTCTANVNGVGGIPSGAVSFGTGGTGNFAGAPCTLNGTAPPNDTCSVTYTPTGAGSATRSDTITATYAGDSTFATSNGVTGVAVSAAPGSPPGGPGGGGGVPTPTFDGKGYWLVASDGGVFAFGDALFYGSTGGLPLTKPVVGMAATPDGKGYWLVASDGGVFAFGDALFYGSTGGIPLTKPVVGMSPTPDGKGYWLVASDGGVFAFGDALFYGSTGGIPLTKPVVGMSASPDGKGYRLVASDGGVFDFGDALFYGSTGGLPLTKPVVGMATTPDGKGYWLVASDGGVFAFGDALFYGSTGGITLSKPVVGMSATHDGKGYWLVASDGGVFAFGDALFYGSTGGVPLSKPVVGMSA